jgi:peptidoglycan/LPS O-acetylase OafA/YrhL
MILSINNPVQSTYIFIAIFLVILFVCIQKKKEKGFSPSLTQELKGFAILAVIFSHIGYFLVYQHEFLYPLSIWAGVGVNIFLFLSGFGLTIGRLKKDESILQFYKKRLSKVLIPFWLVLIGFLLLDYFALGITYPLKFVGHAFVGIFTTASLYTDVNSPFWYLTLLLFYYFLFPILFSKKYPWITAIILYSITHFIIKSEPLFLENVLGLYKVHILAFPLGIVFAWMYTRIDILKNIFEKIKSTPQIFKHIFYYLSLVGLIIFITYFSIHSGIGETARIEQTISLITMFGIMLLFFIKKTEFRLLSFFGLYSYELYLLHWPIMYRYDFLYTRIPAWLATCIYLLIFIALGWVLKKISNRINCALRI